MGSHPRFGKNICSNCGDVGHTYRFCREPVTSYGILAFRVNDSTWNQAEQLAHQGEVFDGMPMNKVEFLLIQRRDSIGYMELIRSKYKFWDKEFIKQQVEGTTRQEREKLVSWNFDQLWTGLWGPMHSPENRQYKLEYEFAKHKFEHFRQGWALENGEIIKLADVLAKCPVLWDTPEWGFPKGRRNMHESDLDCALREFEEETGVSRDSIHITSNVIPIVETFVGNNNIQYKHIYFVGFLSNKVQVEMKSADSHMAREIGAIEWLDYETALERIRPTTPQKREVLRKAWDLLRFACPLLVGPTSR
jgi:8-oxo-dGTP pyrophosphatase MutT (NUDIX family)